MKEKTEQRDKTVKNMKLAFFLNFGFAILEIIGGIFTNSMAIISDAIHDLGDSMSIGIAVVLEKLSLKKPDKKYTYGYGRYSVVGALINLVILSVGSVIIVLNAVPRLINPETVNANGMLVFAILGILVNLIGTLKTSHSHNISEKVINLHLLEDLLGWVLVLVTSIVINVWNIYILDPILSLILAFFIIINVIKNLKRVIEVLLEKIPSNINIDKIVEEVNAMEEVKSIHHVHVWSIDGNFNCFTGHIEIDCNLSNEKIEEIKENVKHLLSHNNVQHSTLEFETKPCNDEECSNEIEIETHCHHHHH